jgi:hypothetical protein
MLAFCFFTTVDELNYRYIRKLFSAYSDVYIFD